MPRPDTPGPQSLAGKAPDPLRRISRPPGQQRDAGIQLGHQMRPDSHPGPFTHPEMRVIGQRTDQRQTGRHIQIVPRPHQEAPPAAHRIGGMILQPRQSLSTPGLPQQLARQAHPFQDALVFCRLHPIHDIFGQLRENGSHQHAKIHGQALCQYGRLDPACIQLGQPGRVDGAATRLRCCGL